MFIVTGGAGFIGSNLILGLNKKGINNILVVDNLKNSLKFKNLANCQIIDFIDKNAFRLLIENKKFQNQVTFIYHQGACSDTTETDGAYMMDNNYTYSKVLLHYALENEIPFVYASSAAVYGKTQKFSENPTNEVPLNVYGYSKLLFDQYVRRLLPKVQSTVIGLRYFNVYGPQENHKGKMASIIYQLYQQLSKNGEVNLFEGTDGYGNGEQRRDFIYVRDVVDINLSFLEGSYQGILNLGTGESRSFNDVAKILMSVTKQGKLNYVPFPKSLNGKYQSYTQADISSLKSKMTKIHFHSLEDGINKTVQTLT